MEVHGNIKGLKKAIKENYDSKIREVNSRKAAQVKEINKSMKQELAVLQAALEQESGSKIREARAMVLNEQKLSAKRMFEDSREQMVQEVMASAKKKFPAVIKSRRYIDFVKKQVPKGVTVYGNSSLKKNFRNLKTENLSGVRFVRGSVIYDLTLDALFEAKESKIREKIIETLW